MKCNENVEVNHRHVVAAGATMWWSLVFWRSHEYFLAVNVPLPYHFCTTMSLLQAKRRALQARCNDLRRAILGDMENLRFELYGAGLISIEARQEKDAGRMVSEIENRLATDEAVWNKLIGVLKKCNTTQMKEDLLKQLSQETGGESGAGSSEVRSEEARTSVSNTAAMLCMERVVLKRRTLIYKHVYM